MGRNKKTYTDEFKLKCIKELLDGKSFSEVCSSNNVSPSTLSDWKKAILLNGFGNKEVKRLQKLQEETEEKLAAAKAIIGQKELEIDLLKKDNLWMLVDETKSNILSISAQCQILKLPRSVYYEKRSYTISDEEKERKAALKEEHNKHLDKVLIEWTNYSTYGYIKMSKHLLREGYSWATEHAIRMIYKELGLKGLTPTSF